MAVTTRPLTDNRDRVEREIAHGKEIVDRAEFYWGWGSPAGQARLKRRAKMLVEHGNVGPGKITLELGCGKGLYTHELEKTGGAIVPVDISWDLLNAAREGGSTAWYHVGDGHGLPFRDATFDSVVGVSVLHHLDVFGVVTELCRVLRPGGRFVFSEPNMLNPQIALQKNIPWIKRMVGDSPDETAFLKWPLKTLLQSIGFEAVTIQPFDFLHPWVPKPLIGTVDGVSRVLEKIPLLREAAGSLLIVGTKSPG